MVMMMKTISDAIMRKRLPGKLDIQRGMPIRQGGSLKETRKTERKIDLGKETNKITNESVRPDINTSLSGKNINPGKQEKER